MLLELCFHPHWSFEHAFSLLNLFSIGSLKISSGSSVLWLCLDMNVQKLVGFIYGLFASNDTLQFSPATKDSSSNSHIMLFTLKGDYISYLIIIIIIINFPPISFLPFCWTLQLLLSVSANFIQKNSTSISLQIHAMSRWPSWSMTYILVQRGMIF